MKIQSCIICLAILIIAIIIRLSHEQLVVSSLAEDMLAVVEPRNYKTSELLYDEDCVYFDIEISGKKGSYLETPDIRYVYIRSSLYGIDFVGCARDINKSRMVGKWTAMKTREFGKGLIDGFKLKSFKKTE